MFAALNKTVEINRLLIVDIAPRPYALSQMEELDQIMQAMDAVNNGNVKTKDEVFGVLQGKGVSYHGSAYFKEKAVEEQGRYVYKVPTEIVRRGIETFQREWQDLDPSRTSPINALVIQGQYSVFFTDGDKGTLSSRFPNAKVYKLDNCTHYPFVEAPYPFVEQVFLFFTGLKEY